ncbi:MAG: hypothetical protein IT347_12540 [Candidatus Eisenbacteria bacterium]|nr:hypothetical protein [Candidatus Eisenbacteria bacterium]
MRPHLALLLAATFASFAAPTAAAPKRALFDNTHAETAGNADWIVDTDMPLPLPDQSTVGPATPRTYWLGAISSWGVDLVKRGFEVTTLSAPNAITFGDTTKPYDLSKFDVFIVPEPNTLFTAGEAAAILAFVAGGGGLVAVGDHGNSDRNGDGWDSPEIWNAFDPTQSLGVHWQVFGEANNNITQNSGNVGTSPADSIVHGAVGIADSVEFHNGTTLVLNPVANPRVRGVIWMNGLAHGNTGLMAARSEYGDGRVFFLGDSSPIDDGSAQPGNSSIYDGWGEASGRDSLLLMNATIWAARRGPVTLSVAPPVAGALAFAPPELNPSSAGVTLRFSLASPARVRLEVLDCAGRLVRVLAEGGQGAGAHAVRWDGSGPQGGAVAPGLYFARLTAPGAMLTRRIARLR